MKARHRVPHSVQQDQIFEMQLQWGGNTDLMVESSHTHTQHLVLMRTHCRKTDVQHRPLPNIRSDFFSEILFLTESIRLKYVMADEMKMFIKICVILCTSLYTEGRQRYTNNMVVRLGMRASLSYGMAKELKIICYCAFRNAQIHHSVCELQGPPLAAIILPLAPRWASVQKDTCQQLFWGGTLNPYHEHVGNHSLWHTVHT